VPFDADDVFGSDGSSDTSGQGGGKKERGLSATPTELARYLDGRHSKYAKRGFVLSLVMDEREIPTLITELSASPFPVEILHVEHSRFEIKKAKSVFTSILQTFQDQQSTTPDDPKAADQQRKRQQKLKERLELAFNANYLATVIICGAFTVYNEPTTAVAAKSAPPTPTDSAKAPAGTAAITGATAKPGNKAGKAAVPGAGNRPSGAAPKTTPAGGPPKAGATKPAGPPTAPTTKSTNSTSTPPAGAPSSKAGAATGGAGR
jgi:hypothetical protein